MKVRNQAKRLEELEYDRDQANRRKQSGIDTTPLTCPTSPGVSFVLKAGAGGRFTSKG